MIERFEKFSCAISNISRYWHRIATVEMEKYGLKSAHASYLTTLYRYPDGLTPVMLGQLCGKDKADVSRMTNIMEEKGLIFKDGAKTGQYKARIKLTPLGMEAAEQVSSRAKLAVELAGKDLVPEEREIFYKVLGEISSKLETISAEGLDVN